MDGTGSRDFADTDAGTCAGAGARVDVDAGTGEAELDGLLTRTPESNGLRGGGPVEELATAFGRF